MTMKRLTGKIFGLLLAVAAVAVCVVGLTPKAQAATVKRQGSCGENVTYTLDSDGVLTISGTGAMKDYSSTPWYNNDWEDDIIKVVVEEGVTYIGNYAFAYCYELTSASLPSTLTGWGHSVFSQCEKLTTVNIPSGLTTIPNYTFNRCEMLTAVTLPSGITQIGNSAFAYSGITSITIPVSTTSIETDAFAGCSALAKITVSSSNKYYATDTKGVLFNKNKTELLKAPGSLTGSYTIPSTVKTIAPSAFEDCVGMTSVTIPSSVTTIGQYAFDSCDGLTSVSIPGSVAEIPAYAFAYCDALTSVTVNSGVTAIGNFAFTYCTNLTTISVPDSVSKIDKGAFGATAFVTGHADGVVYVGKVAYDVKGTCPDTVTLRSDTVAIASSAFYNTTTLTKIVLPEGLIRIGENAFEDCTNLSSINIPSTVRYIEAAAFASSKITSATIPSGVTEICNSTFSACQKLTYVSIPNTVTSIGSYAFNWCEALTSISIPSSVTEIGSAAFTHSGLTQVTLPNGIKTLADQTFYGCDSLEYINLPSNLETIGAKAIGDCPSLTSISIPSSVKTIGTSAFYADTGLESVYISSIEQWCQIDFDGGFANPLMYAENLYVNNVLTTSVTVPSSITQIKPYTFINFENLEKVTFNGSITSIGKEAFEYCESLTAISFPQSLKTIEAHAFADSGLKNVVLPDSVNQIGKYAFNNCDSLESIVFSDSLTALPEGVVCNSENLVTAQLPSGLTEIGASALQGCENLVYITLPKTLTKIDTYAFYNCTYLQHVFFTGTQSQWSTIYKGTYNTDLTQSTIHYNATDDAVTTEDRCTMRVYHCSICADQFACSKLGSGSHTYSGGVCAECNTSAEWTYTADPTYGGVKITGYTGSAGELVIPETLEGISVTAIASYAFQNNTNLTSVTVPDCVQYIGEGAFSGCKNITHMTLPFAGQRRATASETYQYPFGYIFGTTSYTGGTKTSQSYYASSTVSTTSSGYYIPSSLEVVSITDGNILYGAFYNCKIPTINLPDGITSIGDYAFYSSTVKQLTVPAGVTSIGNYAFYSCKALKQIDLPDSITTIGNYAFYSSAFKHIELPESLTSIGTYAFRYATSLKHIVLPEKLTSIGNHAFDSCTQLSQVCYAGTEAQKAGISFGTGNTKLTGAEWYYEAENTEIAAHESCTSIDYICDYCERTVWTEAKTTPTHVWDDATCTTPKTCSVCDTTEGEALGHNGDIWIDLIPASCTEAGMKARICDVCGETETQSVDALGHSYESAVTAPTCTEGGYTTHACGVCGDSYTDAETKAAGHAWGEWTQTSAPGCTESGEEAHTCETCGTTETQTVAATGHSYESAVTAPTCTKAGYTTHTCSVCGDSYQDAAVAATGHSWSNWAQTKAPSCTAEGTESRNCSACGETEIQSVAILEHSYTSVVTAPTCTEQGYTTNTCFVCGDVTVTDYVDAKGHTWSAWIQTKAPTCSAEGSEMRFCNCGTRETRAIEKQPHTTEAAVTAPTCTEAGYTTNTCTVCGDVTTTDPVDALGHSYENGSCTVCGEAEVQEHEHTYQTVVTAPTCTTGGYTTHTCSGCGDTYADTETEATGHSFEEGACTVCGEADPDYEEPAPELFKLEGITMTLGNRLDMNFVIDTAKLEGDGHYAVIVKSYADGKTTTVTVDQAAWENFDGADWYYFTFSGVAAKEMTDTITVNVYNADGEQVTYEWVDSVEAYCIRMLPQAASEEEATLYVDMLNYGAAAQSYFGYKTDDLANADLTAEQQAKATQSVSMENKLSSGTGYVGSALTLESCIQLDIVFDGSQIEGAATAVATYTDHYGAAQRVEYEKFGEYEAGMPMISLTGMSVADCSQMVTLSVYDAEGNVLSTVVDSVESYVARMTESDPLFETIMKFAASSYNYFH